MGDDRAKKMKRGFMRKSIIFAFVLVSILTTCFAQEEKTFPAAFAKKPFLVVGGLITIGDFVQTLPGKKTFEVIENNGLIIRTVEIDRLTRQQKEVTFLLTLLSSEPGMAGLASTGMDRYTITRLIVDGVEQPQSVRQKFSLDLGMKLVTEKNK